MLLNVNLIDKFKTNIMPQMFLYSLVTSDKGQIGTVTCGVAWALLSLLCPGLNTCVVSVFPWCSRDVPVMCGGQTRCCRLRTGILTTAFFLGEMTVGRAEARKCDCIALLLQQPLSVPSWSYSGSTSSTSGHHSTTPSLPGRISKLEVTM